MLKRIDRRGIAVPITLIILGVAALTSGCKDSPSDTSRTPTRAQSKPRSQTFVIPAGTHLVASLDTRLSTETNHTGDPFLATTTEPVAINGTTVAPTGTKIRGHLRDVQASGRLKGRARMTLAYDEIVDSAGNAHSIAATPLTLQAASETQGDVEKIAAGGILGAVIGGIAGGGKGAAIGAGAGAGAGTVLMLVTEGDEVDLHPGQKLAVRMTAATNMPVLARR